MSENAERGLVFESLMFRDNLVEVSFTEEGDRGDGVARIQTLIIDGRKVRDEHEELMDALGSFVDAALVVLRNPPERLRRA